MATAISCIVESGSFHIHATTWERKDKTDATTEYLACFDHITGDNSSSAALADAEAIRQQWERTINPNPRNAGRKPKGRIPCGWRLAPDIVEAVAARAAKTGHSQNDIAEELLRKALA